MKRQAAITRARNLIRQRAIRVNNKPVVYCDLQGNLQIKIGKGGLLIKLNKNSGTDSGLESDPVGITPEGYG